MDRLESISANGRGPAVGDLVVVDHAYTASDGELVYIVQSKRDDGSVLWSGDVLGSELEPIWEDEPGNGVVK